MGALRSTNLFTEEVRSTSSVPLGDGAAARFPREGPTRRRRPAAQAARRAGGLHRDARAGVREALGRRSRREDGRVPRARRERREPRRDPLRGVRRRARGVQAHDGRAAVRRPADGRHRPPRGRHRRDEDRRGQDLRRRARALSQRAQRQGHAPRHRQRLPRQARPGVDASRVHRARDDDGRDREHDAVRAAPRRLRGRRHLRDELGVRLRLPARQHGRLARRRRAARPSVRDRGRGRLDPHRRGAHAAHHLRRAADRGADLLRLRARRAAARRASLEPGRSEGVRRAGRRGLRVRREAQDRRRDGSRRGEGRARAADREPLRAAELAARQPPHPGAEGAVAVPARHRLRHPGRRGEDRRRVHRPHHGGPPLERGPPPGRGGEGGRPHPGRAPDDGDDHPPELLPPVRQARRHDRHGEDGGEGVRRDLQPQRRRDPDERAGGAQRRAGLRLQDEGRQVRRRRPRHQGVRASGASPSSSARSRSRRPSTCRSCSRARA